MQNASSIGQLLSDSAALKKTGKGAASIGDILTGTNSNAFSAILLGGLAKSRATVLSGDVAAATVKKPDTTGLLAQTTLTPELLAQLKNLTPEDLKNLPPELASVFAPHMTDAGTLDDATQNLLDTLSSALTEGTAKVGDLVQAINDPDQASFLNDFVSALYTLQNPLGASKSNADKYTQIFGNVIAKALGTSATVTSATVNSDGIILNTDKGTITVSVADMNLEQFKAFKKLAFSDLAPFLTQQKSIRVDAHTIMKMAQGPSFLDDENAPKVTFIHVADIAGSIPANAVAGTPAALLAQAAANADTPLFLDAAIVAKATAAVTPASVSTDSTLVLPGAATTTSTTQQPTAAQQHVFNRANLFAALLGVQAQADPKAVQATAAQTVQTTAATTAQIVQAAAAQTVTPQTSNTALAQQIAVAFGQTGQRSNGVSVMKGLDTSLLKAAVADGSDTFASGLDSAFPIRADVSGPATSASTLLSAKSATSMHPASTMVSIAMQRGAEGGFLGAANRQFTIQLDPENLGRVKITLEFGDDHSVKAKLVAERPETVALLQKDSGALQRSLHDQGFDVKADGLTFNLGDNGSFSGNMSQNGNSYQNEKKQASDEDGTDIATIHTVMPIFVDPVSGLTHVNIIV